MKLIDPHVHIDTLPHGYLEAMALAGIRAVVAMVGYPFRGVTLSSVSVLDLYEQELKFDAVRASKFLIDTYVAVGISQMSIPTDYEKVLDELPKYFSQNKVVAIGEIGLEPSPPAHDDLALQEEVLKAQLKIAKEYNMVVSFHTPRSEKPKWVEKYFRLIDEAKLEPSKVVIDHADSTVVKMIQDAGYCAGITVAPWQRVEPEDAAKIIQSADYDRVFVDSDSNILEASDCLAVPKTALEMRKLGFREEDIKRVTFDNPNRIFNLGQSWK